MRRRGIVRPSAAEEQAAREERMAKWRADRDARRLEVAREASGEARGFRYAIECEAGWVGADGRCTHREPVVFEGDRESAQARTVEHREERNRIGGATHHAPAIVPEDQIARRTRQRGWS